jgi:hypothetical protein
MADSLIDSQRSFGFGYAGGKSRCVGIEWPKGPQTTELHDKLNFAMIDFRDQNIVPCARFDTNSPESTAEGSKGHSQSMSDCPRKYRRRKSEFRGDSGALQFQNWCCGEKWMQWSDPNTFSVSSCAETRELIACHAEALLILVLLNC